MGDKNAPLSGGAGNTTIGQRSRLPLPTRFRSHALTASVQPKGGSSSHSQPTLRSRRHQRRTKHNEVLHEDRAPRIASEDSTSAATADTPDLNDVVPMDISPPPAQNHAAAPLHAYQANALPSLSNSMTQETIAEGETEDASEVEVEDEDTVLTTVSVIEDRMEVNEPGINTLSSTLEGLNMKPGTPTPTNTPSRKSHLLTPRRLFKTSDRLLSLLPAKASHPSKQENNPSRGRRPRHMVLTDNPNPTIYRKLWINPLPAIIEKAKSAIKEIRAM